PGSSALQEGVEAVGSGHDKMQSNLAGTAGEMAEFYTPLKQAMNFVINIGDQVSQVGKQSAETIYSVVLTVSSLCCQIHPFGKLAWQALSATYKVIVPCLERPNVKVRFSSQYYFALPLQIVVAQTERDERVRELAADMVETLALVKEIEAL